MGPDRRRPGPVSGGCGGYWPESRTKWPVGARWVGFAAGPALSSSAESPVFRRCVAVVVVPVAAARSAESPVFRRCVAVVVVPVAAARSAESPVLRCGSLMASGAGAAPDTAWLAGCTAAAFTATMAPIATAAATTRANAPSATGERRNGACQPRRCCWNIVEDPPGFLSPRKVRGHDRILGPKVVRNIGASGDGRHESYLIFRAPP